MPFPEVLAAAKRGERWALAVLWRGANPRLMRYLAGRDAESADDIASETWLAVAEALPGFEGGEVEFRAWVFTIARNRLIDSHRFALRHPTDGGHDEQADGRVASDDPARDALELLDTEAAIGLVRRLPPDQAEVVLLRVIGGLDVARVADIVGKRPGTVRVLQHRGLRGLAKLLHAEPRGSDVTR